MSSMLNDYWKILTLSNGPYLRLKESENGFSFAVKFFLVLALLTTAGSLVALGNITGEVSFAERLGQLSAQIENTAVRLPAFLNGPLYEISATLSQISAGITQFQPPLGKEFSQGIRLVGGWLEIPLSLLGAWMGAALGIWLIAILMGGQGSLRQHISLLLLAFAPQVLTFLNYIPSKTNIPGWVDNLLWAVAFLWSLVIGVHSLSITHGMKSSKAFFVIVLTVVVFFVAIPLLLALFSVIILSLLI